MIGLSKSTTGSSAGFLDAGFLDADFLDVGFLDAGFSDAGFLESVLGDVLGSVLGSVLRGDLGSGLRDVSGGIERYMQQNSYPIPFCHCNSCLVDCLT